MQQTTLRASKEKSMKSILVADNRTTLLATLEPVLKHWGYRVLSTSKADQVMAFLKESQPCLMIIGEGLLADPKLALDADTSQRIKSGTLPVIGLRQDDADQAETKPGTILDVPIELFELFAFIQRQVENHPRQNLRLRLKLPGMYSIGDDEFVLAEVLTLSMNGLFLKAATKVKKGDHVCVVFPLFGRCKEVEVNAKVLYTIHPDADNNYFQGFGVGFDDLHDGLRESLHQFIHEHFLKEVSASNNGVGQFSLDQIKS